MKLIVFGGCPGTGKATVARTVARGRSATYLRIDTIEQAISDSGQGDPGPAGCGVASAIAAENLALARMVVADCMNPVAASRAAWRLVAARAEVPLRSDPAEHRRRVETRSTDVPGLRPPSWRLGAGAPL